MRVAKIELTGTKEHCFDIEVEDVHEYLLDDGTVVHNSSKAAGCPNGVYPIRELAIGKSDATNTIDWTAPDSDLIGHQYQLAYDVDVFKLIDCYSIIQKFTDQAISADLYLDRRETLDLSATHLIKITAHMQRCGMKSRYYVNSRTDDASAGDLSSVSSKGCASGACTL